MFVRPGIAASQYREADEPAVKTWVYQGTTGTYSISDTQTPSVSACGLWTTTSSYNYLEGSHPAANYSVNYTARVRMYDTASPFPNDCGYHYYKVELV